MNVEDMLLLERGQRRAIKYMTYSERCIKLLTPFVFAERFLISCYFTNIYIIMLAVIFLLILKVSVSYIVYGPLTTVHC